MTLAILNGKFDGEHPDEVIHEEKYTDIYDDMNRIMNDIDGNTIEITGKYEPVEEG